MRRGHTQTFGRRTGRDSSLSRTLLSLGWKSAGAMALVCSGVAWASLPRPAEISNDQQLQWRALGVKPLADGGAAGMQMVATDAVKAVDYVPARKAALDATPGPAPTPATSFARLRIRGRV